MTGFPTDDAHPHKIRLCRIPQDHALFWMERITFFQRRGVQGMLHRFAARKHVNGMVIT